MKLSVKNFVKDLFQNPKDGRISASKLWLNIAFAVSSGIVMILATNGNLNVDIFITYLMIVSGNNLTSKWISMKYGVSGDDAQIQDSTEDVDSTSDNENSLEGKKKKHGKKDTEINDNDNQ
jgi:hypothetical protein